MRTFLCALPLLLVTGCGTWVSSATTLNPSPVPMTPRTPESVEVYSSAAPTRPHVDVALLEVRQDDIGDNRDYMVEFVRKRAAQMGCDALVIGDITFQKGREHAIFYDPDTHNMKATCIMYKAPPAVPADAAVASGP